MKLLALDTSTEYASLSLYKDGEFKSKELNSQKQHAKWILPAISELLAEARLKLSQLDGIVFGCGPGSFTGLRVACSIAQGLAFGNDLPVYPVSTLKAIAKPLLSKNPESAVLALIDARMNQVYWACYHSSVKEEEQVSAVEDIKLPALNLVIAGVGFEAYRSKLPAHIQSHQIYPQASSMISLVLAGSIPSIKAGDAIPKYIRNQVVQGGSSHE